MPQFRITEAGNAAIAAKIPIGPSALRTPPSGGLFVCLGCKLD